MDLGPSWVFVLERLGGASTRRGKELRARPQPLCCREARSAQLSAQQAWRSLSVLALQAAPANESAFAALAQRRVPFATTTR
ncbi:hypothetical protein BDZ90DRAFT_44446 [Jaminaea rosea]|uniref:Uncharacterized protein n=1 Tax=Jaminaea rosea TaxID=1569628 RepID=A0A316UMZ6_9BASI|nr:hypothetical protein BDZ90DRAFT_44446 [Jaminaea rosea]PWN26639.1 hypothetical protein BDZ90DRAFT_44446 [Jaminaea rosea]